MITVKNIFYKNLMQEEFLQILRTLKQNVYIMTSGVEGDRCAVTGSSVTSLSLEPPLIIVCINKNASMHENLEKYKKICLNLLKSSQIDLANLCSGEDDGEKRFSKGEWSQIEPVYLTNAQSNIFCTIDKIFPFQSHSLVVGKIYDLKHSGEKDPLIYQDGEYE